jgi:hypothetical protein
LARPPLAVVGKAARAAAPTRRSEQDGEEESGGADAVREALDHAKAWIDEAERALDELEQG